MRKLGVKQRDRHEQRRQTSLMNAFTFLCLVGLLSFVAGLNSEDPNYDLAVTNERYSTYLKQFNDPSIPKPDLYLAVPNITVGYIDILVAKLNVAVSLKASVANLVKINVGASADVDETRIVIRRVNAQLLLQARLDKVRAVITQALDAIDANPSIVTGVATSVGGIVSDTPDTSGNTVLTSVDALGNISKKTVSSAGQILSVTSVGNVKDLKVVQTETNSFGQKVIVVEDNGIQISATLDSNGNVLSTQVLNQ
ncbi:hypothetical protein PROFUN_00776 [Planoprotostelium fungivorum]|uniref:Uncharacterized protein n=1 Tax=Planoprotostelium fungivorum TaxID=1890364 RepID=A0A2P6NZY3_9EUKA|nr:hypothetical protein PROFUN_00776 [Planoprotostelium fungivorum]